MKRRVDQLIGAYRRFLREAGGLTNRWKRWERGGGLYCSAAPSKFIASRATIPRYREPFRVAECNRLSRASGS